MKANKDNRDFSRIYELFLEKENIRHNEQNLKRFCIIWNTEHNLAEIKAKNNLYERYITKTK